MGLVVGVPASEGGVGGIEEELLDFEGFDMAIAEIDVEPSGVAAADDVPIARLVIGWDRSGVVLTDLITGEDFLGACAHKPIAGRNHVAGDSDGGNRCRHIFSAETKAKVSALLIDGHDQLKILSAGGVVAVRAEVAALLAQELGSGTEECFHGVWAPEGKGLNPIAIGGADGGGEDAVIVRVDGESEGELAQVALALSPEGHGFGAGQGGQE